jgi:hypothetical protein
VAGPVLINIDAGRTSRPRPRRPGSERRITVVAIALAGAFVALAILSAVVSVPALGVWLPVHLLLAGGAATAIAGVMPFFSSAVANAPPAPGLLRMLGVLGVAAGAALVAGGRLVSPGLAQDGWLAGIGGLVFTGGLLAVAGATLLPLRSALGGRRMVVGVVYGMALVNVIIGATLASLLLLGWLPAAQAWPALKPAHAWLNVFGFVSLVIAGSLLHLMPTVVGARIGRSGAAQVVVVAITSGPLLCAAGFILESHIAAVAGAVLLLIGAAALAAHGYDVVRRAARWTTDPGWHRFTTWSLVMGLAWFVVGSAIAAWLVIDGGAGPAGWRMGPLMAPIGIGWVAQVLIGAWSHLVPAVGPGSPQRHAAQRRRLGPTRQRAPDRPQRRRGARCRQRRERRAACRTGRPGARRPGARRRAGAAPHRLGSQGVRNGLCHCYAALMNEPKNVTPGREGEGERADWSGWSMPARGRGIPWLGILLVLVGLALLIQYFVPTLSAGTLVLLAIATAFIAAWLIGGSRLAMIPGLLILGLGVAELIEDLASAWTGR